MTWINGCPTSVGHYWVRYRVGGGHPYEDLVRVDREGVVIFEDGNGYWVPEEAKNRIEAYSKVDSVT